MQALLRARHGVPLPSTQLGPQITGRGRHQACMAIKLQDKQIAVVGAARGIGEPAVCCK